MVNNIKKIINKQNSKLEKNIYKRLVNLVFSESEFLTNSVN